MRQIFTLLMLMGVCFTLKAQLVINENFTGYTNGALNGQGSWARSGGGADVTVTNASPLIYSGYASGTQNITVAKGSGRTEEKAFSTNILNSSNRFVFMSFVVRVPSATNTPSTGSADYALRITDGTNSLFRFYIGKDGSNNLKFGTSVGTSSFFATGTFNYNQTYLVIIRYDIVSGSNNDDAHMWIDPSLASEPGTGTATNSTNTNSNSETGYGNLSTLEIEQTANTATAAFDAFKVATGTTSALAWSNLSPAGATLPVVLDHFDAMQDGNGGVKLVWNTSEELNLKQFSIERSTDGFNFNSIGSVDAGNKQSYTFTDGQPAPDNNFYRLRMIDKDGNYKVSFIVSIKSKLSVNIVLSPNPVKDVLTVQHPKAGAATHVQVIGGDGRTMKDILVPMNAVQTTVDFSGFRTGLYYVVFKTNNDTISKTIIKQ